MTRIVSQSPSVSPAIAEAGRRFQLPPSTEKRTQGSTLFSTTAKNLISSIPFRWRQDQNKIFEDWIRFKGPNAMSADLLPLLRALDLDGYEDVKNDRGECVHDLIIVKVRRKITNTKKVTNEVVETKKAFDTPQPTRVHRIDEHTLVTPLSPRVREEIKAYAFGIPEATAVKREPKYSFWPEDPLPLSEMAKPFKPEPATPGLAEIPELVQDQDWPGIYRPTAPATVHPPAAPQTKSHRKILTEDDSGEDDAITKPSHPAPSRYGLRSQIAIGKKLAANRNLSMRLDKLKAAMEEFSFAVSQLPTDNASESLATATHDTNIDVDYLEDLVREYLEDKEW